MFNTLFHYPRVLARHRQGPSAQARERYLTHCANQGAACNTLLRTARELLVIAQRLDLTADQMISTRQLEAAEQAAQAASELPDETLKALQASHDVAIGIALKTGRDQRARPGHGAGVGKRG
jgi:hypothetical protein